MLDICFEDVTILLQYLNKRHFIEFLMIGWKMVVPSAPMGSRFVT